MPDIRPLKRWIYKQAGPEKGSRKDVAGMLKEFEQFFVYLFNASNDGISILDSKLTILGVNHTMEEWYSDRKVILGKKCYEVYHNRNSSCIGCPTLRAVSSGKRAVSVVPYEGDGAAHGAQELSAFPMFDDAGTVVGIIEYVRDVTRQKKEERVTRNLKRRLRFQFQTLHEQEIALDVLLKRDEKEQNRRVQTLLENIERLVMPIVSQLAGKLQGTPEHDQVELIRTYLGDLLSPFVRSLVSTANGFTPREVQIADLVKRGMTTKEIADLLGISAKGVDFHRMNIRKKLRIANQTGSLQEHLSRQV